MAKIVFFFLTKGKSLTENSQTHIARSYTNVGLFEEKPIVIDETQ